MSVFTVLETLALHIEKEVNLVLNAKQDADTLSYRLKKIQEGLEDAERQGATNASVKRWLKEIEDVAYEMEDVLDEWEMENLRVELEGSPEEDLPNLWEKVRSFFNSLCRCFTHVVDRREIVIKMKALSDRLDAKLKEKDEYNFQQSASNHFEEFQQPETTSDISEKIYGRDSDIKSLVEKLLSEGGEEWRTEVVSIVGHGGAGKTTLTQKVYNHDKVKENFTLRAWVSVPRTFDTLEVGRRILDVFGVASKDFQTLQKLVVEIRNVVVKKKFLLVLDNVWTEDHTKWASLKNCLHGAPGSKILVTTRSKSVARMMGDKKPHNLGLLSNEDCVNILMNEAALSNEKHEQMRPMAVEIAKKCNGLPLAVRNVGRMLAFKSTEQEWQGILENPLWRYEDEMGDLYRLLKLSYFDLSHVLKCCFLSCLVFPRNFKIHVDEIIRIWMACGYLNSRDNIVEKGLGYFRQLATRLFFQKSESDEDDEKRTSFKVHDIMYDFAIYLSNNREYNFIMDGGFEGESSSSQRGCNSMSWNSIRKIRTLYVSNVSEEELQLGHLEHVRVLIMSDCKLRKLPEEVGKLIHLRHLDLSNWDIVELSEFVCDLYNLETLVLTNCSKLSKLPKRIDKLKKLRHILNEETHSLAEYSQGLEKLIGLWTLNQFNISKASDFRILSNLNQLQGKLFIGIELVGNNAHNLEEVTGKAILKDKTWLQHLELLFEWDEQMNDVLDALQPPPNLQHLTLYSKRSQELSRWIDTTSFNSLKVVTFLGSGICCNLPLFYKLSSLEKLIIQGCDFQSLNMEEFLGIEDGVENAIITAHVFPKLKILEFNFCSYWKEWEDIKEGGQYSTHIMPCLQQLSMNACPNLKALPHRFLGHVDASLQSLKIYECNDSLASRYSKEEGGSDWDKISHIPHIHITTSIVW